MILYWSYIVIKKIKDFIENYFLELFNMYFGCSFAKYFIAYAKPLMLVEQFNNMFDSRLQETFMDEFNLSFDKMLNSFDINDNEVLDVIKIAEAKFRKGNGEDKLKFVCSYYAEQRKEDIMQIANVIIKERVERIFIENQEQINSMIMEAPICL